MRGDAVMAKIGCNWSEPLFDLVVNKQVEIDYIKTGAFGPFETKFDTMRSLRPVLIHPLGHYERAGMNNVEVVDFDRANRLLAESGSPHYGLHLCVMNSDLTPSMSEADIAGRMYENIQLFKKNMKFPVLVENIPDTPQEKVLYDHYPYAAPEKISKAIADNDVDFLLDITHAKITCMYKEWDIHDYLKALPLHRIREIHTNGSGRDKHGYPDDTHHPMADEDHALLEWVLQYADPHVISLEYVGVEGESPEVIKENLIDQLKKINKAAMKGAVP
jgi:hypothetical protein